jgi:hypothetical protein
VDRIFLHPQAQDFLFEYYRALRLIFNDVLGHLEVDYISIALLNPKQELLFLSSQPSIEQNLIEHGLWSIDPCLQFSGLSHTNVNVWNDLYKKSSLVSLKHYKLDKPKLNFALSKSIVHREYHINYSFGVKTDDPFVHINLLQGIETLVSMGKFCLQNILKEIYLDIPRDYFVKENSHLKLVTNNN